MIEKSIIDKVIDYVVVFLFVITSGSIFYVHVLSPAITYFFLLFVGFINKLRISGHDQYIRIQNNYSWWFIFYVIVIAIVSFVYYEQTYDDNNLFGYIVVMGAAYYIISTYNFNYFRKLLTDVVFVITLTGLPVFLLNELEVLPTFSLPLREGKTYTMFLCYTLGWPYHFHRFSGIWHEPGACQIVLNTVLWLHFENFTKWKWENWEFLKILVIIFGSLSTLSTGSYLSLMLLLISIVPNLNIKSKYKLLVRLGVMMISIISVVIMFNTDVVQNKLFRDNPEEGEVSRISRTADAMALYQMTIDRPVLGYGLGTHDFWQVSKKLGNTSNSSGLLTFSASLGVTWLVAFIVVVFYRIRKMGYGKESVFLLLAVLVMQFNEKYIEYPITSIFVFNFGSYIKSKGITIIWTDKGRITQKLSIPGNKIKRKIG